MANAAAAATTEVQQVSNDELFARQLQQQEMQQYQGAGGMGHPTIGMGHPQMQMGQPMPGGPSPVVQGMVVSGQPVQQPGYPGMQPGYPGVQPGYPGMQPGYPGLQPGGAPVIIGAPAGVGGMGGVVAVEELQLDEMIVLRYRYSLMCFAVIDAFASILHSTSMYRTIRAIYLNQDINPSSSDYGLEGEGEGEVNLVVPAVIGACLIVGPLCGLYGARTLSRPLVSVYLGFCVVKTSFEIFFAVMTLYLWFILVALVQLWVSKIVFQFWRALGRVNLARIKEIIDPTAGGRYPAGQVGMAYW